MLCMTRALRQEFDSHASKCVCEICQIFDAFHNATQKRASTDSFCLVFAAAASHAGFHTHHPRVGLLHNRRYGLHAIYRHCLFEGRCISVAVWTVSRRLLYSLCFLELLELLDARGHVDMCGLVVSVPAQSFNFISVMLSRTV